MPPHTAKAPRPVRVPRRVVMRRVLRLALDPLGGFNRYIQEYGTSVLLDVGGSRRSIVTTDPDLIQHVLQRHHRNYEKSEIQTDQMGKYIGYGLLTNTGESWLRQRRLIQPGFHKQRMKGLVKEMQSTIAQTCAKLDQALEQQADVNISHFTLQLTFSIIARAIFTDGFNEQDTQKLNEAVDKIQGFVIYPIRLPFLRPIVRWIGLEAKYQQLSNDVGEQLMQRVNTRRASKIPQDDLLQMLLDSRYEDNGQDMEDAQLIDEIKILFAAGHETSANALAWILYLLAKHPEEADKARAEIAQLPHPISMDALRQVPYLTAIIEEGMRLYPPAWITDRVALENDQFGDYTIPKNMVVAPYIYGLHHSEAIYPDAEKFLPERMLAEEKKKRHPFAFIPFGGGPRLCIGSHFAMLEMQLVLVHLLRHYAFSPPEKTIHPKPFLTLRPAQPIRLRLAKV